MLLFILFVINQTAQVVQLAKNMSAVFGAVVFWALLVLYSLLILARLGGFDPLNKFLRLVSREFPKTRAPVSGVNRL
jgi:hypothetical protein